MFLMWSNCGNCLFVEFVETFNAILLDRLDGDKEIYKASFFSVIGTIENIFKFKLIRIGTCRWFLWEEENVVMLFWIFKFET